MSLATIEHACDAVQLNDYLEPFALPAVPSALPGRPPAQRSNYGRVLSGTDNRATFGKGEYVMVDRGSDHGVALGAQFVVYRDKLEADNFLFELADAVAVDVRPETATLRVTRAIDGVTVEDPQTTHIDHGVSIGHDTVIRPHTVIETGVSIGKRCTIGPFTRLRTGVAVDNDANVMALAEFRFGAGRGARNVIALRQEPVFI